MRLYGVKMRQIEGIPFDVRITVDIDEAILNELPTLMGETKTRPAVSKAVSEYVKRRKAQEFGRLLREGEFDYPVTNEQIEEQDV